MNVCWVKDVKVPGFHDTWLDSKSRGPCKPTLLQNQWEKPRYLARFHRASTHALAAISTALLNRRNDTRICIASEGGLSHSLSSENIACHWKAQSICWIRWSILQHHSLHCRLQFGKRDRIDVLKISNAEGLVSVWQRCMPTWPLMVCSQPCISSHVLHAIHSIRSIHSLLSSQYIQSARPCACLFRISLCTVYKWADHIISQNMQCISKSISYDSFRNYNWSIDLLYTYVEK